MSVAADAGAASPAPVTPALVRGAGWNALSQLVPVVGGIVLTPYLVHHLGLTRYGLYVLALTVAAFLRAFDGGLGGSALRYFAVLAGKDDRAGTTRLLGSLAAVVASVGAAACVVVALLAPVLVRAFGVAGPLRPEGTFLLRTVAVGVVLSLLGGLLASVLVARQEFRLPAAIGAVVSLAALIATWLVVRAGYGLRGLALVLLLQAAVTLALLAVPARRWLSLPDRGLLPRAELAGFFRFAGQVQLVGLAGLITLEADAVVVGVARGTRSVGLYSVGSNFASQLRNVTLNGLGPIASALGRNFGSRGLEATADFEAAQRVWVTGVTGWCCAGAGAAYVAMVTWLGPGFDITGVVATVLLVSNMVNLWTACTTVWLQTTGHPGIEARYAGVGIATNLLLTVALIVPFGLVGIVIGTAAGQVVASFYLLRLVRLRVPHAVRSFLLDVPVLSGVLCAAVTVAIELAVRNLLPSGAFGLVLCGLCTLPGLAVFGWRERWAIAVVRHPGTSAAPAR